MVTHFVVLLWSKIILYTPIEAPFILAALLWVIRCNKIMTGLKGEESYHHSYWCKCLGTLARPGWIYSVALDFHGSSSYSLTIPNLGLRYTNIPAQYPMLVFQRPPSHKRTAQKLMITLAVPSWRQDFKPKYVPDCHGADYWDTSDYWTWCINVLHSNLWLPVQAGERPWRSETIGVAARKMSEYFCARRHPQVGFLVRFGFTTKWISWNWSRKVVFDFSNCSGPLGACF